MSQIWPYLVFLACPVSMGAMMWMMMRGSGHRAMPADEARIQALESQLRELRQLREDEQASEPEALVGSR